MTGNGCTWVEKIGWEKLVQTAVLYMTDVSSSRSNCSCISSHVTMMQNTPAVLEAVNRVSHMRLDRRANSSASLHTSCLHCRIQYYTVQEVHCSVVKILVQPGVCTAVSRESWNACTSLLHVAVLTLRSLFSAVLWCTVILQGLYAQWILQHLTLRIGHAFLCALTYATHK